ncbi:MATE family efflux transporter [Paenibacillus alvei]|uniref:MATE family efflux transporter n=1 Tax=Paenibacillus alvei TaxID=44250 RepID=UPI003D29E2E0
MKSIWKKYKSDFILINSMVLPMLSAHLMQLLFQIGDQAIVGRLSIHEFAAVGIVGSFIYFITGSIGLLGVAFNIIGAKYLGNDNKKSFGDIFNSSITLAVVLGVICECLILIGGKWVLVYLYGLDSLTLEYSRNYLYISGIINLVLFIFSAYFKNLRKTKIFFISTIVASIVNISLDYVLVFGKLGFPQLGTTGAAIGSVVGLLSSVFICIIAYKKHSFHIFRLRFNRSHLKELVKLYIPLSLQDLVESSLFMICLTMIVSRLHVTSIASYNVITTLLEFLMLPAYAYAGCSMTLTAQAYSKNRDYFTYIKIAFFSSFLIIIPLSIVIVNYSSYISGFITDKVEVILQVKDYLMIALLISFINAAQQIMKYTLQSIDYEKWVMYFSTIIYGISIVIIWILSLHAGLWGIYFGLGICYLILMGGFLSKIGRISKL